eukprot:m.22902 g.22902  ORF g.22902 m.22902 type:complete len:152 (+) comp3818_c1_seq1:81-536(+)
MATSAAIEELKELIEKRRDLKERLVSLESQIYNAEGAYLTDTQAWGNIFKGWDGYIANKAPGAVEKKNRKLKDSDRLFSLSSCTAPQGAEPASQAPIPAPPPQSENDLDDFVVEKKKRKKYIITSFGKGKGKGGKGKGGKGKRAGKAKEVD